ncbi:hypothetical protein G7Y89_g896 [Cudoniella acicularis]|uniref:Uncharacterized protein n=1 Tax=Cudoniella acicularis TaxID=354080 RepID=A0A8H4W7X0_9HELO|nr:hypothetical protein G7Y89_g896 [Cudoniella acicularis]
MSGSVSAEDLRHAVPYLRNRLAGLERILSLSISASSEVQSIPMNDGDGTSKSPSADDDGDDIISIIPSSATAASTDSDRVAQAEYLSEMPIGTERDLIETAFEICKRVQFDSFMEIWNGTQIELSEKALDWFRPMALGRCLKDEKMVHKFEENRRCVTCLAQLCKICEHCPIAELTVTKPPTPTDPTQWTKRDTLAACRVASPCSKEVCLHMQLRPSLGLEYTEGVQDLRQYLHAVHAQWTGDTMESQWS